MKGLIRVICKYVNRKTETKHSWEDSQSHGEKYTESEE